jgi:hypothetical protein
LPTTAEVVAERVEPLIVGEFAAMPEHEPGVPRNSGDLEVPGGRVRRLEVGCLVVRVGTHRDTVRGWQPSGERLLV